MFKGYNLKAKISKKEEPCTLIIKYQMDKKQPKKELIGDDLTHDDKHIDRLKELRRLKRLNELTDVQILYLINKKTL